MLFYSFVLLAARPAPTLTPGGELPPPSVLLRRGPTPYLIPGGRGQCVFVYGQKIPGFLVVRVDPDTLFEGADGIAHPAQASVTYGNIKIIIVHAGRGESRVAHLFVMAEGIFIPFFRQVNVAKVKLSVRVAGLDLDDLFIESLRVLDLLNC